MHINRESNNRLTKQIFNIINKYKMYKLQTSTNYHRLDFKEVEKAMKIHGIDAKTLNHRTLAL